MKQTGPVLEFQAAKLLGEVPGGSKKVVAEALADKLLSWRQASSLKKEPTPQPQDSSAQENPSTVAAALPTAQSVELENELLVAAATAEAEPVPAVQEDSGEATPAPQSPPASQVEKEPSPAAKVADPDPPRPGQKLGSPPLTLEHINEGKACQIFQMLRDFWKDQYKKDFEEKYHIRPWQDPGNPEYLEDDTVHQGIAALTEALDGQFSLTTHIAFAVAGGQTTTVEQCKKEKFRLIRPRKPVIVPYAHNPRATAGFDAAAGSGHHFLVTARVGGDPDHPELPRVRIYDSAPGYTANCRDSLVRNIYRRLRNLQWYTWPGQPNPTHPFLDYEMVEVYHQDVIGACGILTILNGWIDALDLHPVPNPKLLQHTGNKRKFDGQLRLLVNLALRGCVDTRTIFTFLKCSQYIREDDILKSEFDIQLKSFDEDPLDVQYDWLREVEDSDEEIYATETQASNSLDQVVAGGVEAAGWGQRLREAIQRDLKPPQYVLNAWSTRPDAELDFKNLLWHDIGKDSIDWTKQLPEGVQPPPEVVAEMEKAKGKGEGKGKQT